jgi:hypothetical protein
VHLRDLEEAKKKKNIINYKLRRIRPKGKKRGFRGEQVKRKKEGKKSQR